MEDKKVKTSEGFAAVYKEIADIIGPDCTYAIYKSMRGQQISLPKRLYTTEYILDLIKKNYTDSNIRKIALEYDYTEKYLRQLLKMKEK